MTEKSIHYSSYFAYLYIVEYYISNGCIPNALTLEDDTILHLARSQGQLNIVKFLFLKGYDQSLKKESTIHQSCFNCHNDIVEYLIVNDFRISDLDSINRTPPPFACVNGDLKIIGFFVEKGRNVNSATKNMFTPLHLACCNGFLDSVIYLV